MHMASKRKLVSEPEDSQPEPSKVQRSPGPIQIDSISDKELLSIFSRLPLYDLLHSVELVNHRWRWLALKCCSDRTLLSLLQTPTYQDQLVDISRYWFISHYTTRFPFEWECIRVTKEVNSAGVQWLSTRFPKVTELVLYCVDHLSMERFVELIELYPNLERLVLFSTAAQQIQYNQAQFWTALQGLESLSHLYLPFDFDVNPHPNQLAPLIKPNLRTIFCNFSGPNPQDISNVILQYENVVRVGLSRVFGRGLGRMFAFLDSTVKLIRHGVYPVFNENALFSSNITQIMTIQASVMYAASMTHLDISIPANVSLLPNLANLALLTRLSHIRFTEQRTDGQQPPSQFFSGLTPDNYRTQLAQPNHTLPSIRHLHLTKFDIIQPSSIFRYFSIIFPQIDTLHIEDCTVIDSTGTRTSPYWFLTNVRRFAQLRQVYHNSRLVLEMDREKDGDYVEMNKLVRAITNEMFKQRP